MIAPPETVPADSEGGHPWLAVGLGTVAGFLVVGLLALFLSATGQLTAAPVPATAPDRSPTGGSSTALTEAPAVGYLAPQFTLADLAGQPVNLNDFRGRPVWLNFWASWCGPCRAEMPEMRRLYAKYRDQGLVLLGVDLGEKAETVTTFVTENKYDWTFLLDQNQQVGQRYYISGIPTHAFIDRQGVIRQYVVSGLPATMMESYLATILAK